MAWFVAALAAGCLESPPSAGPPGSDGGGAQGDAGAGSGVSFPPSGAAFHLAAMLAADMDRDQRDDLILLDDDDTDDWTGLYVLRSGPAGWSSLDAVQLDFRPTALRHGRLLRATGAALAVGGAGGEVVLVDYQVVTRKYVVVPLEFDTELVGGIAILHSGIALSGDDTASLLVHDGSTLWGSTPVVEGAAIHLEQVDSGWFMAAAFWPPRGIEPFTFVAARLVDQIVWYREAGDGSASVAAAVTASFVELVNGMCGTHLVITAERSLAAGWIACDGTMAGVDPVVDHDLSEVLAAAAGDLGGGSGTDLELVGLSGDGSTRQGQVLFDIEHTAGDSPAFTPAAVSLPLPLDGVLAGDEPLLAAADVEGDGSALVYAISPAGAIACADVIDDQLAPCPAGWEIDAP